ncbi:MAG: hypothetical protein U0Y08_15650 [Bacteroidia bacterium]
MKRTIILTAITLMGCQVVFGQTTTTYDFKTKTPPLIKEATHGQTAVFKIDNINRFLYEVKIEAKQTEFHSEPPAVFNQIFKLEKKESSSVGKEADKVLSGEVGEEKASKIKTKSNEESLLLFNERILEAFSLELGEQKSLPDTIQNQFKIQELEKQIEKLSKDIETQKETIKKLNDIIEDEYLKVIQDLYTKSLNVGKSFELVEESKVLKNRLIGITLTDGLTFKDASEKVNELFRIFPFSNYPEKLTVSFERDFKQFKAAYELYLINEKVKKKFNNDEAKVKSSVSNLLQEVESIKATFDKTVYSEIFQNINLLFNELRNENNFFVVSDPVQAEKDVINFDIKITPRKDLTNVTNLENRQFSTSVPIKGGVKIDFSTGLFITTGLHDRRYSLNQSSTDSLSSTISENKNNNVAQISLGALMHISPRTTKYFKPGFTFGFGLNSTDISNANVFLGISGMFGSQERFIASLGLSLAQVDYLKGEYGLNKEYITTKINSELTEKTTRAGFFISLTYNLTNKKKE